jgi:hypothetical protein
MCQVLDSADIRTIAADNLFIKFLILEDYMKKMDYLVFGSNLAGIHGAGAAHTAYTQYGATWGQGVGASGKSYAIPTKDKRIRTLPLVEVSSHVRDFIAWAKNTPECTYYVTKIGCGLAGFNKWEIAPMFKDALELENVKLPKDFLDILCKDGYNTNKISFDW